MGVWVARLLVVWVARLLWAAVDLALALDVGVARLGKAVGIGAALARGAFWATVGSGPSLAMITSVVPAVAPINASAARRTACLLELERIEVDLPLPYPKSTQDGHRGGHQA